LKVRLSAMPFPLGIRHPFFWPPALVLAAFLLSLSSASASDWGPLQLLDREIAPGQTARLGLLTELSFTQRSVDMKVLVARGTAPGPTLCLTAAVHGDEVNGVEIARKVFDQVDPAKLSGTLIAVPIVNVWGFRSGNRYLPDRRDLNRGFPGNPDGSLASRIAFALFHEVIQQCDALVDLHTGSDQRANVPQIRVDLSHERATALATHFGVGIVMEGAGPVGSLRRSAIDIGLPAIIYEAGGPSRFEAAEIDRGIDGVHNVMAFLEMEERPVPDQDPQRVFRSSSWVRSPGGGIFLTERVLGESVEKGALLGTVTDPVTHARIEVLAPDRGLLVGRAHPQVVLPGFGLFHIARTEQGPDEGPPID
jgi:predicted deacylase